MPTSTPLSGSNSRPPIRSRAPIDQVIVDHLTTALREIEYGQVLVTIHAGKIAQIDTTSRCRFAS